MEAIAVMEAHISSRSVFAGPGFWSAFCIATATTTTLVGFAAWFSAQIIVGDKPNLFQSETFQFELPKTWLCTKELTETVCRSEKMPREAVIILTRKYRGPSDNVDAYIKHLSKPISLEAKSSRSPTVSEVVSFGTDWISGRKWVIGRHLGSEVENYYTDYYATMTASVSILITFSVHRDSEKIFRPEFDRVIRSLKVYQQHM
jgi:hypothetical protein